MATKSILHEEAYPRNDTDDYGEFHKYFHTQEKNSLYGRSKSYGFLNYKNIYIYIIYIYSIFFSWAFRLMFSSKDLPPLGHFESYAAVCGEAKHESARRLIMTQLTKNRLLHVSVKF
jgi:hypothetical protein